MSGVVLVGAVGHLDDQAPGLLDEERERVVAGDGVCVDGQTQGVQPRLQRGFPDRPVPLDLGSPDVVHEDVQVALVAPDARHERADLRGHEVVHPDRDPVAARLVHESCGLLDGLRAVHLRPPGRGRPPGHIDGCSGRSQLNGDPTARTSRGPGDQGHSPCQRCPHMAGI